MISMLLIWNSRVFLDTLGVKISWCTKFRKLALPNSKHAKLSHSLYFRFFFSFCYITFREKTKVLGNT